MKHRRLSFEGYQQSDGWEPSWLPKSTAPQTRMDENLPITLVIAEVLEWYRAGGELSQRQL